MAFDFINTWLAYSDPVKAPSILRLWAGLGVLSCILSRRVWLQANSRLPPLYPNIYCMLLADPGKGKDLAINMAEAICRVTSTKAQQQFGQEIFHNGGESISPKGLLDKLKESKQHLNLNSKGKQENAEFHSLSFFIGEATTAMPEYNPHLIGILNDLYNCKSGFSESIRGIEYTIKNPHIMMLMGNQPSTFYRVFPEATFAMGFTSRMFLVFSNEDVTGVKTWLEPEEEAKLDNTLWDKLVSHLLAISQWSGELKTTKEYRQEITNFEETNPAPVSGTRFKHWNTRRSFNVAKLAILIAASEKDKLVDAAHFKRALNYLFEIERRMPHAFEDVITDRGFSGDLENITNMAKLTGEVTQYKLVSQLSLTRPPYEAGVIIDQAIRAGILVPVYDEAGAPV